MVEVQVSTATADDAISMGATLAPMDAAECMLQSGLPGWNAVYRAWVRSTRCKVAKVDGKPMAMWGVVPTGDQVGEVWLLTTDLRFHLREFLTTLPDELLDVTRGYRYLYNYIWTKQKSHIRLLERLGAILDEEDTIERNGETLVKFIWRCGGV